MFRPLVPLLLLVLTTVAVACSDGSDTPDATPTPVFQAADPDILSAFVLAPEDAAPLAPVGSSFSPAAAGVVSFFTVYGDNMLRVQSTVGTFGDIASRELYITDIRRALAAAIGNERNLNLEGIERGFVYRYLDGTPSTAAFAIKGSFYVLVQMISEDGTRQTEVFDETLLNGYVQTSIDRIRQYEQDPTSVQRPDWAPMYAASTPVAAIPTPSPE